jgi:hypothetical protein
VSSTEAHRERASGGILECRYDGDIVERRVAKSQLHVGAIL